MDKCLKHSFFFACLLAVLLACRAAFVVSDCACSYCGSSLAECVDGGARAYFDADDSEACVNNAFVSKSDNVFSLMSDPLHSLAFAAIHFSFSFNFDCWQNDLRCLKPVSMILPFCDRNFKPCGLRFDAYGDNGILSRCTDYYVYALERIQC